MTIDARRLAGRLVALEELMIGFMTLHVLTGAIAKKQPPGKYAAEWESDLRAGLQHLHRPFDERSDEAWEVAAEELEKLFARVRTRLGGNK